MDAYGATHKEDVMRVTLAMGLTKSEARKMGIEYALGTASSE